MNNSLFYNKKRFDICKKWCADHGIVPQVSKLRVGVPLENGKGRYDFDIQNAKPQYPGEVVLNRNDVFIPFGMGILLSFDNIITEANGNVTAAPTGKSPLFSYAPKAGVENKYGFLTDDIEALYNGTLSQYVDQTLLQQSFPAELFKHVPGNVPAHIIDQEGDEVSLGIQAEYNFESALHSVVPNIIYQGDMDIRTIVEFNGTGSDFRVASADDPAAALTNVGAYLNFVMYGILIKNAAQEPSLNVLKTNYSAATED